MSSLIIKMLIKLDEERISYDGYDVKKIWEDIIDKKFEKTCTKEVLEDGSRLYVGKQGCDYYTEISVAFLNLRKQEWFAKYCLRWLWRDGDYYEEDILQKEYQKNPLFIAQKRGKDENYFS